MVYAGCDIGFRHRQRSGVDGSTELDVSEIDWDPQLAYDKTLREAAIELVEACPAEAETDDVLDLAVRWIPGFGQTQAEAVLEASEREDTAYDLAEYM